MPLSSISKRSFPFSVNPFFLGYLNPQVRIIKMANSVDYHPCPSRLASRVHPITVNFLGLYLSSECLLNFFSNLYIFHHVWDKFMVFTFLENALNLSIFAHISPAQNLPPSSCHHTLGRRKLLIPPGSIFAKICFPQQQKVVEETMICFIKIQSENTKITWDNRLLYFV